MFILKFQSSVYITSRRVLIKLMHDRVPEAGLVTAGGASI